MTTPLIWVQFACSGHEFESKCTSMIFFSLTIIILFDLFKKKRFEGIISKKKVFLMGNRTRVSPVVGQTARRRLRSQSIFLKMAEPHTSEALNSSLCTLQLKYQSEHMLSCYCFHIWKYGILEICKFSKYAHLIG